MATSTGAKGTIRRGRRSFGRYVRIESSTLCQLRCPSCFQTRQETPTLGRGYLSFDDFKRFVDAHPQFTTIELANKGEMFLNPDLEKIIRYAHERDIRLTALSGVNFNTVSDALLEQLVKCRFRAITVALDGATPQSYARYRVGGDFNRVLENIRKLNDLKARYRCRYPELVWQFIIFGYNEHEMAAARQMAERLGMRFMTRVNYDPSYSPSTDAGLLRKEFGRRAQGKEYRAAAYLPMCLQLWCMPQVNWDGRLLGCCRNEWGDYGNVFKEGLEACMASARLRYAKRMLLGVSPLRNDIPCSRCPGLEVVRPMINPLTLLRTMYPIVRNRLRLGGAASCTGGSGEETDGPGR